MLIEEFKYLRDMEAGMLDSIEQTVERKIMGYEYKDNGWVCNSLISWKIQHFQDWSESKVNRAIKSLEKQGLIRSKKEVHKQGYYLEENIKLQELYVRKVGDNYQNQLTTIKTGANK